MRARRGINYCFWFNIMLIFCLLSCYFRVLATNVKKILLIPLDSVAITTEQRRTQQSGIDHDFVVAIYFLHVSLTLCNNHQIILFVSVQLLFLLCRLHACVHISKVLQQNQCVDSAEIWCAYYKKKSTAKSNKNQYIDNN